MRALTAALIAASITAAPAAAQPDTVYVVQTPLRSPALAAILEVHPVIPLLGHWYAGDVKRGLVPTAVNVAGLPVAFMCLDLVGGSSGCSDSEEAVAAVGALAFLSGWVWRMVSAYNTAKDQNAIIAERQTTASLLVAPLPQRRLVVGVALRF